MVKIFDRVQPWPNKVNFVDSNNVVVGYDMTQNCCEHAGWDITESENLDNYVFDTSFFEEGSEDAVDYEVKVWVKFKMVDGKGNYKYLILYNTHNGYYSHGFTFGVGEESSSIHQGDL